MGDFIKKEYEKEEYYNAWMDGYLKGITNTLKETGHITKWLKEEIFEAINFINKGENND